jgi:hypothetical protein
MHSRLNKWNNMISIYNNNKIAGDSLNDKSKNNQINNSFLKGI